MAHCILFVQKTSCSDTRTYFDYESINECMDGVCKIFEDYLKTQNPSLTTIAYDVWELFQFIDQLRDLSVLVFNKTIHQYAPRNKVWIKEKLYTLLKNAASRNATPT